MTTGLDLCEIDRIRHSMRNPRFCGRVLGEWEYEQLKERGFPPQSVAASFSAKEAFGKAMHTGLAGFSLREVQLMRKPNGVPYLALSGAAARLADGWQFSVSVTHTAATAAAVVLGERKDAEI
ncbi:holo-[acyl-carrier-protein] synthase [Ruminococcaceae bacterium CPB6]|uniref:Holo-[acyl-carrier-protein] synthase n=1 Tax=Caproicibacterium lactatifermentans TaxID=2666138 RepID=A0A859DTB2_9FIRM|nr:holo-[acyl-carrier-protein] synthase [Ruminococcaceae bacterium CPB6]QKN24739.1 holo-[acyl-carrier-protein] synthase [Caproicibacterium lactatifermentans]QKO31154.1 holo-[acyl-carrier-protein] synthase [Caproicibacterium lactatifermentans]